MSLNDIYCQDKAIGIFQNAWKGSRMAHAYIFAGSEGVGKFKTAVEIAKVLLCEKTVQDENFTDSCGNCKSCKLMENDSHPDFHHVHKGLYPFTEKGKNSKRALIEFPVDVIREFLIEKVSTKPSAGKYSIYVLDETEKVNKSSQNAMLKVLEEPPSHCLIILLCTSIDKLLPTTRSRCQIVRFSSIDEDIIIDKLKQEGIDKREGKYWARFCSGSMGGAILWSSLDAYNFKRDLVDRLCKMKLADAAEFAGILNKNTSEIATTWSKMDEKTSKSDITRRTQKYIIQMLASVYSDSMKIGIGVEDDIVNFDQIDQLAKLTATIQPDQASEKIQICCDAVKWVDSYVNAQLVYERLLLELAK